MEKITNICSQILQTTAPVVVFAVVLLAGYIIRKIIFARVTKWAQKTKSQLDDIILDSIKAPFIVWSAMVGLYLAIGFASLPQNVTDISGKVLLVLGIFSVTMTISSIVANMVQLYSQKTNGVLPGTSLTKNIGRIIIFTIGVLVILNTLGISITPIWPLGVGGPAVASLQETLSIYFRFHILWPGR